MIMGSISQPGREQTLYLPQGHVHSGLGIASLQTGQRGVLLGNGVGMGSVLDGKHGAGALDINKAV
jgi:hypothetical protein